jgi:CSLREA domain-containing protein
MRAQTARLVALAAALTSVGIVVPQASSVFAAGPFTVNTTVDAPDASPGDGRCVATNGLCTLRAAVQEASFNSPASTITLPAGSYALNTADPRAYNGGSSKALQIASNVTINGAGSGTTIITGSPGEGVLDVQAYIPQRTPNPSVSVSGVTVTGGGAMFGAGVTTGRSVNLSLTDVVITGNSAAVVNSAGAGIFAFGEAGYSSTITLNRVTVSNNVAWVGAGIVAQYPVNMVINNSLISGNVALGPYAGGIRNMGAMSVNNTVIVGNLAGFGPFGSAGGGGVYNGSPPNAAGGERSTFTMTGGGIIYNTVSQGVISNGGGLLNETAGTANLTDVTIAENVAFEGGGILNDQGTVIITSSDVTGNKAYYGAGIYNNDFTPSNQFNALMSINRSSITGNVATDFQCPTNLIPAGNLCGGGGGVFNENADVSLVNTTVADNTASTFGGGIYNLQLGGGTSTVHLTNATVSSNLGLREGGGVLNNAGGLQAKNSIVSDNLAWFGTSDCFLVPPAYNTSFGNNITTDGRCGFVQAGDKVSTALLGPALFNGGRTVTLAPFVGSAAVDAADNATCNAAPVSGVDQRGTRRPSGNVCDIGAFEGSAAIPGPSNMARPVTYSNGAFSVRYSPSGGPINLVFGFGLGTDTPLMCDFDGDGTRSATVVRATGGLLYWFGRNANYVGPATVSFAFGIASDVPICGDWDGDGVDTPGVMRNVGAARQWIQSNQPAGAGPLNYFYFGAAADRPMHGDWDGNGTDTPGITRPVGGAMLWSIRNSNSSGASEGEFYFGASADRPVVGDWDNNGADSPGVVRVEGDLLRWWTRNTIVNGDANATFLFGSAFDTPMVWKGRGVGGI